MLDATRLAGLATAVALHAVVGPAQAQQRIQAEPCSPAGVTGDALCGTLQVPLDWADADGPKIELSLVLLPPLDSHVGADAPPLFYLAGGPGGAASQAAPAFQLLYPEIRRTATLVLVDQRGTGGSNPLRCELGSTADQVRAMLAMDLDPETVRRCRSSLTVDPQLFGTSSVVRDIDAVREGLGYRAINLLAQSYGTRVALAYLREYGDRVRTATLQGVAPFSLRLPGNVAVDVDSAIRRLSDKCTADRSCAIQFGDVFEKVRGIAMRLDDAPVLVEGMADGSELALTHDVFMGGLRTLLYVSPMAQQIPRLIQVAEEGDFAPLVGSITQLAGALSATLHLGAYLSVVCSEDIPHLDTEDSESRAARTVHGPGLLRNHVRACEGWQASPAPPSLFDSFQTGTPTLLLSGELDPVTPPFWADQLASTLPESMHVVVPYAGHADAIGPCEDGLIAQFVTSGTLEALDAGCSSRRPPLRFVP